MTNVHLSRKDYSSISERNLEKEMCLRVAKNIVLIELFCYGLNIKCHPQDHVLGAWLPAGGLFGNDWILRALTKQMDWEVVKSKRWGLFGGSGSLSACPGKMYFVPCSFPRTAFWQP
jgi:hypothetical protein